MLPLEMRERQQWVVCGSDKQPYYCKGGTFFAASVINPATWMSFEEAQDCAASHQLFIGYVLSAEDPFVCLDFDVVDSAKRDKIGNPYLESQFTPEFILKQQDAIVNSIDSYKEISASGKGIHLWIQGNIGAGVRRGGIEVYSQERFIICTGVSFQTVERYINDDKVVVATWSGACNESVTAQDEFLVEVLKCLKQDVKQVDLAEVEPTEADDVVISRAVVAVNGDKFCALSRGEWKELGYPSQSEADLSLMSMLAFYSQSNEQCRRLFRQTKLGQREKSVKNDTYLNRTLQSIRSRQEHERSLNLRHQLEGILLSKSLHKKEDEEQVTMSATLIQEPGSFTFGETYDFNQVVPLDYPPGVLGEICQFVYGSAPRPVKEVAIVAGLGLIAGAAGRAYHFEQTGLNLYLILIAQSAIGKEAMHSGIGHILKAVSKQVPEATNFVDFSEFVSYQALVKKFKQRPSFVNVSGELGRKISLMAKSSMDSSIQGLRTTVTNLYQKSNPGASIGGLQYSKGEDSVEIEGAVAYSLIGETTPGTLYDCLTEDMMEDGFMSRFSLIQYTGERVPLNYNTVTTVGEDLLRKLTYIFTYCVTGNADRVGGEPNSIRVRMDDETWLLQFDFNIFCDKKINSYEKESYRQMWNRAHLKALRMSGLLAVCDNPANPVVKHHHMRWAINLVLNDVQMLSKKLNNGDVGTTDDVRMAKVRQICEQYLTYKDEDLIRLKLSRATQKAAIIPRSFLQMRTCALSSFRNHKNGSTFALNQAIQALVDNGSIIELDSVTKIQFNLSGKLYRIIHV